MISTYFIIYNWRAIGVLTSGHHPKLGQIIDAAYKGGLVISKMRRVQISSQDAYFLLESQRDKTSFK